MFDRVVVLNLRRRPDKWEAFCRDLPRPWPFVEPQRVCGVDGRETGSPDWWHDSPGAWGCYVSHLRIWEDALTDRVESLLVLEDDCLFAEDFVAKWVDFAEVLPEDWDQIYLGGEWLLAHPPPVVEIRNRVTRWRNVNRTHAYGIRRWMLTHLYQALHRPSGERQKQHIDHRIGDFQEAGEWNVYAPWRFICGQRKGISDVIVPPFQRMPAKWWNQFPIEETVTA